MAQVDKLFHVSIGSYRAQGVPFLANSGGPSVPAGLHVLTVGPQYARPSHHPPGRRPPRRPGAGINGARRADRPGRADLDPRRGRPGQLDHLDARRQHSGRHPGDRPGGRSVLDRDRCGHKRGALRRHPGDPGRADPAAAVVGLRHALGQHGPGAVGGGHGLRRLEHHGQGPGGVRVRARPPTVPVKVTDIPADGDFSDTSGNVEWELDTQASTGMAPSSRCTCTSPST